MNKSETQVVDEIERKYLLKRLPFIRTNQKLLIEQFYVKGEEGVIRYRKTHIPSEARNKYEKIIKKHVEGQPLGVNKEHHFEVEVAEWFSAYQQREKEIKKTRHLYYHNDLVFEVDEFEDLNLILCEVELSDFDQPIEFPEYITRQMVMEVTPYKQFSNYNLAEKVN